MQISRPPELPELILIEPRVFRDERGFFLESYRREAYVAAGVTEPFVQDNHSFSGAGVLRGLHYQHPNAQGKLIRVILGEILDVAIDIRLGSPTFGHWLALYLSADSFRQLYLPPGFAHGFLVTGTHAEVLYKCTAAYDAASEHTLLWSDPELGIEWPDAHPLLSDKDRQGLKLAELEARGELPTYAPP